MCSQDGWGKVREGNVLAFLRKTFRHPVFPLSSPVGSLRMARGVFFVPSLPQSPESSVPLRVRHTLSGCPAPLFCLPSSRQAPPTQTGPLLPTHTQQPWCRATGASLPIPSPPSPHRPPLLSPLRGAACLLPEWVEDLGNVPRAGGPSCFPLGGNAAFFTFHPEKYGSQ